MQAALENFLKDLREKTDVIGIALFGSYAKGTNRLDSDIDLLVITKNVTKRDIIDKYGSTFEIVYSTAKDAEIFYKNDLDNYVRFWNHAKILFDPEKKLVQFQKDSQRIAKQKPHLTENKIRHALFNFEDQLRYITAHSHNDLPNALFILHNLLVELLEFYFDFHQIWKPAPKEILKNLEQIDPSFAQKTKVLILEDSITQKIEIFEKLIAEVRN